MFGATHTTIVDLVHRRLVYRNATKITIVELVHRMLAIFGDATFRISAPEWELPPPYGGANHPEIPPSSADLSHYQTHPRPRR
jgi:hypothetical protein